MRVLLVRPPIQDFYRTKFREYPLALLYLASSLKDQHQVSILDCSRGGKDRPIPLPEKLKYLEDYYTPEKNLFLCYKHFGISFEELARRAKDFQADVVCISSMFTPYFNEVIESARHIKSKLPNAFIIVGGVHATADPQSLLQSSDIDLIIAGEGEITLSKILDELENEKLPTGEIIKGESPNIDQLPLPARELIEADRYLYGKKRRYTQLFLSRGCPHSCSFCSVHTVMGHSFRCRSNADILDEIQECREKHGIEVFDLQDDNLLYHRDKFMELLQSINDRYAEEDLEWMATNGLNVASLDQEMMLLMQKVGFKKLDLALGTGPVPSRKGLQRPENIQQYDEVIKIANDIDLPTTTYIILGLPSQPLAEIKDTVNFLKKRKTLIAPSVFYNVPGMPIFDQSKKFEYCSEHLARRSTAFNNFGNDFTRDDIFNIFCDIREYNLKLERHD